MTAFFKDNSRGGFSSYCKMCKKLKKAEQRVAVKKACLEYKGGKCVMCGYDKYIGALDFHHVEPNEKDFIISGSERFTERVRAELDKCIVLCANCHREVEGRFEG